MKTKNVLMLLICFIVTSHIWKDYNSQIKESLKSEKLTSNVAAVIKSNLSLQKPISFSLTLLK